MIRSGELPMTNDSVVNTLVRPVRHGVVRHSLIAVI